MEPTAQSAALAEVERDEFEAGFPDDPTGIDRQQRRDLARVTRGAIEEVARRAARDEQDEAWQTERVRRGENERAAGPEQPRRAANESARIFQHVDDFVGEDEVVAPG